MTITRWRNLLSNVAQALTPAPWQLPRAFFGDPASWSRHQPPESEFSLLNAAQLPTALRAAWHAAVPALPGLFRTSAADTFPRKANVANPWPDQSWLFINGICTDEHILDLNARMLHRMFGRPLTLLHNQTSGVVLDLAECALGKGWLHETEAVRALFPAFLAELLRPEISKVVLLAHSQGTILTAVFLHLLRRLVAATDDRSMEARIARKLLIPRRRTRSAKATARAVLPPDGRGCRVLDPARPGRFEFYSADNPQIDVTAWFDWSTRTVLALPTLDRCVLDKLEVYCFATCASELRPVADRPYLEHFGNEHDMVAKLGVLAPDSGPGCARIEGNEFMQAGAWGHLLNAHYLSALEAQFKEPGAQIFKPRAGTSVGESRLRAYWCEQQARAAPTGQAQRRGSARRRLQQT